MPIGTLLRTYLGNATGATSEGGSCAWSAVDEA